MPRRVVRIECGGWPWLGWLEERPSQENEDYDEGTGCFHAIVHGSVTCGSSTGCSI